MNKAMKSILLLLIVSLLSGCWDRTEMYDVSFFLASALDLSEEGEIITSILVTIPARTGGESGKVSESGVLGKLYCLSYWSKYLRCRKEDPTKGFTPFFKGHRSVVFIGEALAKKGIREILDYYSRDPGSRLRTYLVVAKGREAWELIHNDFPMERFLYEEVRELERSGVGTAVTFRDFLMMQSSDGIVPVTGAVEMVYPMNNLKEGAENKI